MMTAHGPDAAPPERPGARGALAELGWDADRAAAWAKLTARRRPTVARGRAPFAELTPARVAGLRPDGVLALTGQGPAVLVTVSGALLAAIANDPAAAPCLGDWVVLRAWPDRRRTVELVLPRHGVLLAPARAGAGPTAHAGRPRAVPIAANVDVLLLAAASVGEPRLRRLASLVERARAGAIRPMLLVTEAGQPDASAVLDELATALPGVPLAALSTVTGSGLDQVRAQVGPGRSAVLLGVAGAARRALLRTLVSGPPGAGQVVGLASGLASPGLLPLPGGGVLLDPPSPVEIADTASFGKARDPVRPARVHNLMDRQAARQAGTAATRAGRAGLRRPPD